MTAEVTGKRGSGGAPQPEAVTMDLFGGCSGEDEVVDLEVKVPIVGWERRLDVVSGKTFPAPHRHQVIQGHDYLNLPPPSTAATNTITSVTVYTIDMVRFALEHADAASPTTLSSSSASTSSSSSSSAPVAVTTVSDTNPAMCVAACLSCLMYVLVIQANPLYPLCKAVLPPLAKMTGDDAAMKKPKLDLNCAADETE